jgi:hypothetical protein
MVKKTDAHGLTAGGENRRLNIVISCSQAEADVALVVTHVLENLLGHEAHIFRSTGMELGSEWIDQIREAIEEADLFLLLATMRAKLEGGYAGSGKCKSELVEDSQNEVCNISTHLRHHSL